jgi:hypothetical protein
VRRTSLLSAGILLVLGVFALVEALRLRDDWLGAKLRPAATPEWPEAAGFRRVALIFVVLALDLPLATRMGIRK